MPAGHGAIASAAGGGAAIDGAVTTLPSGGAVLFRAGADAFTGTGAGTFAARDGAGREEHPHAVPTTTISSSRRIQDKVRQHTL
jgi:hypothetical protein